MYNNNYGIMVDTMRAVFNLYKFNMTGCFRNSVLEIKKIQIMCCQSSRWAESTTIIQLSNTTKVIIIHSVQEQKENHQYSF